MLRLVYVVGILFVVVSVDGRPSLFAPKRSDERRLEHCLLTSNAESGDCFPTIRTRRSVSQNEFSDSASEYLCGRNAYQNSDKDESDLLDAVTDFGSCSGKFPYIARSWKKLLNDNNAVVTLQQPTSRSGDGTTVTASFTPLGGMRRNNGALRAVDIVITRENAKDVEVYGKYKLQATIQRNRSMTVYDGTHSTCPPTHGRSFVIRLDRTGADEISEWMSGPENVMEISIKITAEKQIVPGDNNGFEHSTFDIGASVSGMLLHFNSSDDSRNLMRRLLFSQGRNTRSLHARVRRSGRRQGDEHTDCYLENYVKSFRNNPVVVGPQEVDIGGCVGSCRNALTSGNNAGLKITNHAALMLLSGRTPSSDNPEPTVCCIPLSYRDLYMVVTDERDMLMSIRVDDMIPTQCGCQ